MRVLLDNNIPAPLRRYLRGHQVSTARQMNWHQLENGDLLSTAERSGFEVMITGDKNLSYQQNLTGRKLSLIVLATTRWRLLRARCEDVLAAVNRATPGSFDQLVS